VCCYAQKSVLNIKKIVPASPNLPKQPNWFYLAFCAVALSNFSLLNFQRLQLFLYVFCNQKTIFIKYYILFWSFCNSQVPKIPLFSFFFGHSKFVPKKGARGAPGPLYIRVKWLKRNILQFFMEYYLQNSTTYSQQKGWRGVENRVYGASWGWRWCVWWPRMLEKRYLSQNNHVL